MIFIKQQTDAHERLITGMALRSGPLRFSSRLYSCVLTHALHFDGDCGVVIADVSCCKLFVFNWFLFFEILFLPTCESCDSSTEKLMPESSRENAAVGVRRLPRKSGEMLFYK